MLLITSAVFLITGFLSNNKADEKVIAQQVINKMLKNYFAEQKSEWVGKRSLDFTLSTIEGKPVKLSDYRGKTIVLDFWASDCIPCMEEMGILEKIYRDYKSRDLTLFGVNSEYNEYRIRKTVRERGITFPILHDKEEEIAAFYEINAVPRLIIIDKAGIIKVDYTGILPESKIREELGKLGIK